MNTTPPSPKSIITSGSEKESERSPRLTHSFSNRSLISSPRAQLSIGERNKCVKTTHVTASSDVLKPKRTRLDLRLRWLRARLRASFTPSRLCIGIFSSGSRYTHVGRLTLFDAPTPQGSQRRRQSANDFTTGVFPVHSTAEI